MNPTTTGQEHTFLGQMAMLVFLLGSLLDAFTTTHVFTHPGLVEANPIVNIVLFHSGPFAFFTFLGFKFAIVGVFVAGVLAFAPRTIHRTLLISVAFTCGFLWLGAGIWNSYLLWF